MVWPISGWKDNNKATLNVKRKESKYFKYMLWYFWLHKIRLINTIKKGLTNSIGWNLGKKYKSIHLLDPLTSMPMRGTNINKIKEKIKITTEYLRSLFWSIDERTKITNIPKKIKTKCLKKNE